MEIYYEVDEFSNTLIKKSVKRNGDIKFDFFEELIINDLESITKSSKYSNIDNSAIEYKLDTPYITNSLMNAPLNDFDFGTIIEDKLNTYNEDKLNTYNYNPKYLEKSSPFSDDFKAEHA